MITEQKPYRNRTKRHDQERALDDALENTFPASDPISLEQPADHVIIEAGRDLAAKR